MTKTTLKSGRASVLILLIAAACAVLCTLLPESAYQRWQLLDGTIHARSRWIYERVHYDPTPVDVVLVGSSRVGAGVSAPRLSAELAKRGLPSRVVNFALPEGGRNINAAIIHELLMTKTPKLIVIGVVEKPSRYGHSAFKYVAPRNMIVNPGYLGNLSYLPDLAYLPFRQLKLFGSDLFPGAFGLTKMFDPARYPGSTVETTGDITLPDGKIKNGSRPASAAELRRGVAKFERGATPAVLGDGWADVEFGDERYYIRQIVAEARAKRIPVAFLSLPYYTGTADVQQEFFYRSFGPVWNGGFVSRHAEWYGDYGHLTSGGAKVLTDWLAPLVAHSLEQSRVSH